MSPRTTDFDGFRAALLDMAAEDDQSADAAMKEAHDWVRRANEWPPGSAEHWARLNTAEACRQRAWKARHHAEALRAAAAGMY